MADGWRVAACNMLAEGFGVEDIGVKLSVPLEDVQCLVRALRNSGRLVKVLKGEKV